VTTPAGQPELVDAQVHVWDRDHPGRPWDPARTAARAKLIGTAKAGAEEEPVTYDDMAAAMTSVGVSAAVLVATSHYGWDNSYSFAAVQAHPGRFAVIARVNPAAPDVADQVQALAGRPGAVGVRILVMNDEHHAQVDSGFFTPLLRAAAQAGLALSIFPPGHLADVGTIARAHPELPILVDHLGMAQPPLLTPDDPPLRRLPELLALAAHANVAVKITAAPVLSEKPFPYTDLWGPLHELLGRFGPERCAWGTDWQRVRALVPYEQGVRWITDTDELSAGEKQLVLGASLRRLLRWPPPFPVTTLDPGEGRDRKNT
jgi:predicted TIM-barrel fold metal-dependent hydrolase